MENVNNVYQESQGQEENKKEAFVEKTSYEEINEAVPFDTKTYPQFASSATPDDDKNDTEEEDEDEETDSPDRDWGTVDPQEHPGASSGMDPSGPGSAV